MNFDAKTNQWKVVVTCIVISTTFWFFSALNKDGYVTQINYPLGINYDQSKYIATEALPDKISIEVTGGGWDLMTRFFGLKMTEYELKIEDPINQSYVITSSLRSEITPLLEPITLNYFLQDSINYHLEELVTRTISLGARNKDWTGSLSNNFQIYSDIRVTPNEVILKGPSSSINALPDTIWLLPDERNIDKDVNTTVPLPTLPNLTTSSLQEAEVSFNIVRLLNIDVNLPIEMVNFPKANWELEPKYVPVSYQVAETNFDIEDTASIVLKAFFKDLKEDSIIVLKEEILSEYIKNVTFRNGNAVKVSRNE